MKTANALAAHWQAWWPKLAPREQRIVGIGAALVAVALLWWMALAPALRTLSTAAAEHARLDAQLQHMTALQLQARALQSQPRMSRDDAARALEASVRQSFGANAQLQTTGGAAGDGIGVQLRGAPADTLAQWLGQARDNASALPREAHLTRAPATVAPPAAGAVAGKKPVTPPSAPPDERPKVQWDGTLVMKLPGR